MMGDDEFLYVYMKNFPSHLGYPSTPSNIVYARENPSSLIIITATHWQCMHFKGVGGF